MKITRAFDFLYHQLENFPKADALNYKYDGTKTPTQHKVHDYAHDQLQNISNLLQEQKIQS
jgi:hypothetical protein